MHAKCKGFVAQVVKSIYICIRGSKFGSPFPNFACINNKKTC